MQKQKEQYSGFIPFTKHRGKTNGNRRTYGGAPPARLFYRINFNTRQRRKNLRLSTVISSHATHASITPNPSPLTWTCPPLQRSPNSPPLFPERPPPSFYLLSPPFCFLFFCVLLPAESSGWCDVRFLWWAAYDRSRQSACL